MSREESIEREKLRVAYQLKNKSTEQIAAEFAVDPKAVKIALSEYHIGEPIELLRKKPSVVMDHHGSIAEAAEALDIPEYKVRSLQE